MGLRLLALIEKEGDNRRQILGTIKSQLKLPKLKRAAWGRVSSRTPQVFVFGADSRRKRVAFTNSELARATSCLYILSNFSYYQDGNLLRTR